MLKTIPHFPPKFKHRKISAIRGFPEGCQISEPVMETLPPPAESEPLKVEKPASASNSNQKEEAEGPHGSTPPEKEIKNEVVVDNGTEGWGEAIGKMEALGSPELVAGMEIVGYGGEGLVAKFENPEALDVFSENSGLTQFASRIFGGAKRRKMSVVRHFPAGCGRDASKIGFEDFMTAASSESKTGAKKLAIGVGFSGKEEEDVRKRKRKRKNEGRADDDFDNTAEKDEDDEEKKVAKPVQGKKVLESSAELRVKSPKPRILDGKGEKKPLLKQRVVGNVKQIREKKVGEVRNKVRAQSLLKNGWDENIMEEHKEKKFSMKSTSEKRMEETGAKQVIKNQIVKRSRDVSAPSGSKSVDKGGRSMMKKPIGNVSIKRSKDGNTHARNFSEEVQHESHSARQLVKKTLRLFEKLVEEEETKSKETRRVDLKAAKILKENNKCVNHGKPILGDVPGVEVGDEFHYRVELAIIGVHRPYQGGIDYMKRGDGKIVATSIVASGGYPDDLDSSDVLIYSGSGGNPDTKKNKQAGDQKLERGNLALKNSMDAQTPVRVIFGSKEQLKSNYHDSRAKTVTTFIYDGLYLVEKYWTETGTLGFSVFKFQLRRMPRNQITREDIHERE